MLAKATHPMHNQYASVAFIACQASPKISQSGWTRALYRY